MEQALSIGADHVVDYTREDFTRDGQRYDLICEVAGNRSIPDYRRALKPGGICLVVGFAKNPIVGLLKFSVLGRLASMRGNKKIRLMGIAKMNSDDLEYMAGLMATGRVRSVIEERYRFDEVVQVFQYSGQKHTHEGKSIIVS
jgi:NADPH:quinone reductase-like Zn-dependent oxidoreductase